MKIKLFIFILSGAIVLTHAAGRSDSDTPDGWSTRRIFVISHTQYTSFDEYIGYSDCAAAAEFVAFRKSKNGFYVEYEFKVNEILYGDIPEKSIFLFSVAEGTTTVEETGYTYEAGRDVYTPGEEYILIMNKRFSLFFSRNHVRYMPLSDIIIPTGNIAGGMLYGEQISAFGEGSTRADAVKYITEVKARVGDTGVSLKKNYIESGDLGDIVLGSDKILEVKVLTVYPENELSDSQSCLCEIVEVLKGATYTLKADTRVTAVLLKGSVKAGGRYILMLTKPSPNYPRYLQSSELSVVPADNKKLAGEIRSLAKS